MKSLVVPIITLAFLASGCRTTTTDVPANLGSAVIVRAVPESAWRLVDEGRLAGFVVRFETPGSAQGAYFSVRNEHQQELGIVDVEGRAWRYRAHARESDWLGTGTVVSGARAILGASEFARLVAVSLDELSGPHVER